MKKLVTVLLLVFIGQVLNAQGYRWATRLGGSMSDFGRDIAVDNSGNSYTLGTFQASMSVTTSEGTSTLTSAGGTDIYFTKSDPNGNYLWIRKIGGTSGDDGVSLTVDGAGNTYAVGNFQNTVDFDPGVGTYNLTSFGGLDIFVLKLDPNGQFLWVQQLGGTGADKTTSITLDGTNSILLTGTFESTADFDPGAGTANLSALGAQDIFICKLTSGGAYNWANSIGNSTNLEQTNCIAIDQNNDVYITGLFYGTIDFDPGAGVSTLIATGIYDAYLLKLSSSGTFGYAKKIAGANISSSSSGSTLVVDSNGNVYMGGSFQYTSDFDPGAGVYNVTSTGVDNFLSKFDPSGNFIWTKQFSGTGQRSLYGLAMDPNDNCYVAGSFENTTDFDPGPGTVTKTSAGTRDIYILKLNASGDLTWVHALGSTGMDQGFSIATDASQNVYATGYFFNTVDFNPGQGTNTLTTSGMADPFILKLGYCEPDTMVQNVASCGPYTWINGITYTTSTNSPVLTLTNIGGCDSIVHLNLTVNTPSSGTDVVSACNSYTWINGTTYTSSNNTATHTLTNAAGCDSIVTLNLTLSNTTSGTDVQQSCGPFTWINGTTYYISNTTATHILTNATGCDSIVTLHLTVRQPSESIHILSACDSYTWIDGITYTNSNNSATHLLTDMYGCDSLIRLQLTINHSTSSTQNITACGSYTWINCVTYTSSTTATHTLTNAAGCDSIITLNLTILPESYGTDIVSTCAPFTWINGNTYTSSNTTATHTLTNAAGCDSIVTLNLTILPDSYSTDVVSTCAPFIWIDGNTYTSSNNSATHILTNAAGCDSIVSLDLTILPTSTVHQIVQTCGPYTWIDGNTYTASTNSVTHTLTNAAGCDSMLILQLTIVDIDTSVTVNSGTLTANQNGATYQWMDCSNSGSILPGETGQSFTPQVDGNYAVRISSGNCTELSRCIAVNTQQLTEQGLPLIQVFPNPVFDLLTISSEAEIQSVQIYNASGQLVQTSVSTSISTSELAPGVYHLRILTGQGTVVKPFIKE